MYTQKTSVLTSREKRGYRGGGGGRGSGPHMKNNKNIGFLSNTGPTPLKNHKATKPTFNVGPALALKQNTI